MLFDPAKHNSKQEYAFFLWGTTRPAKIRFAPDSRYDPDYGTMYPTIVTYEGKDYAIGYITPMNINGVLGVGQYYANNEFANPPVLKVGSIFISAAAKSPAIIPLIKAIGMDPTDNVEHEMINLTLTAAICGLAALVHQKVLESPFNI